MTPNDSPQVRADGRCLVCGKRRPEAAIAHRDPFHSANCARSYYGLPEVVDERNGMGSKLAAKRGVLVG